MRTLLIICIGALLVGCSRPATPQQSSIGSRSHEITNSSHDGMNVPWPDSMTRGDGDAGRFIASLVRSSVATSISPDLPALHDGDWRVRRHTNRVTTVYLPPALYSQTLDFLVSSAGFPPPQSSKFSDGSDLAVFEFDDSSEAVGVYRYRYETMVSVFPDGLPSQWSQPGMPFSATTGSTMDTNSESPGGSLHL